MKKFLSLAALSLVLLGFGCGKTSDDELEARLNAELGDQGEVDFSDDTFTYEGEDGEMVMFGENLDIPSDFPADMPVYPGGNVISVTDSPNGSSGLDVKTSDDYSKVVAWYESEFASWNQTGKYEGGGSISIYYEKEAVEMTMIVAAGDDTVITLLRTEAVVE